MGITKIINETYSGAEHTMTTGQTPPPASVASVWSGAAPCNVVPFPPRAPQRAANTAAKPTHPQHHEEDGVTSLLNNVHNLRHRQPMPAASTATRLENSRMGDDPQQTGSVVASRVENPVMTPVAAKKSRAQATLQIAQRYGSAEQIAQAQRYLQQTQQATPAS